MRSGSLRQAYFTLEMSLVFPVVLFIMTLIIHFAFYLYGRCILSQDTYLIAFRGSILNEEKAGIDRYSYMESIAGPQFGSKYFANDTPSLEIEISSDRVHVRSETEASHRAMGGYSMMPGGSWAHGAGAGAEIVRPAARIRRIDRMADVAKGLYDNITGNTDNNDDGG